MKPCYWKGIKKAFERIKIQFFQSFNGYTTGRKKQHVCVCLLTIEEEKLMITSTSDYTEMSSPLNYQFVSAH